MPLFYRSDNQLIGLGQFAMLFIFDTPNAR